MNDTAVFSPCRTWRYTLTRDVRPEQLATDVYMSPDCGCYPPDCEHVKFKPLRTLLFVCLNPSKADETKNDNTVIRCMGFARDWGFDKLVVCNIFSIRSTDPKALYTSPDPIGPDNTKHISEQAVAADMIVAAWGDHGILGERGDRVRDLLYEVAPEKVHVMRFTKKGEPGHPLYLKTTTVPTRLWPSAVAS